MNINVDPDWTVPPAGSASSNRSAGPLGFTGTERKRVSAAAGLATLEHDDFGSGAVMPMLPGTWNTGEDTEAGGAQD